MMLQASNNLRIHKLQSRVAITTDLWTANYQKKGYMAVTAHFIDDDWNLRSFILRFIYVPAPYTAYLITEILHDVLADWNLESRLSTITLDNCSTNDKLMENILEKMQEPFSSSNYATTNLFFPKACGVYLAMKKWATSADPNIKKMSDLMTEKYEKYWKEGHGILAIASVLDPRYKLHLLTAMFIQIYGEEHVIVKVNIVKEDLYKLMLQYQNHVEEGVGTSNGGNGASSSVAPSLGADEVFDIFYQYMTGQPIASSSQLRTELDLHLDEEPLHRTQDFDTINWWKFGGIRYPTLRKIARDIMAIPITTVASESAFSTGGRVISPNHGQLIPQLVEALMCVQAWGRVDMLGKFGNKGNALKTVLEDELESDDAQSTVTDL